MSTPSRWRAYICCGPHCTLRRSPGLIDVLQREVDAAGLADEVEVMPGGCMKHCERGPSLAIWPGPTHYEFVDPVRLRGIVREHLGAGRPLAAWLYREPGLPGPPRRAIPIPYIPPLPTDRRPSHKPPKPERPPQRKRDADDFRW